MAIMEYFTPTHVYFGIGAADEVGNVLKGYGAVKVLLHFGSGSVRRTGLLDDIEEKLRDAGIEYVELGGVVPNPRVSLVRKGIELYNSEGCDFILTHPMACVAPKHLEDYKIHDNPPGISGWLCEGRVIYDAFVLNNKKAAIFYHGTAIT